MSLSEDQKKLSTNDTHDGHVVLVRRFWHRATSAMWTAIAVVVVLLGIMVGLFKLALPYVDRWTPNIENFLSQRFHQSVAIDHISGEWVSGGPQLELNNLKLGKEGELQVDKARLKVDLFYWLRDQQHAFLDFALSGIHLDVDVSKKGDVNVKGIKRIQTQDPLAVLFNLGQLHVVDTSLRLAIEGQEPLLLDGVDVILYAKDQQIRVMGLLSPPKMEKAGIRFQVDVETQFDSMGNRDIKQLDFYSEAKDIEAGALPSLHSLNIPNLLSGNLTGKVWLTWKPGSVLSLTGEAQSDELVVERMGLVNVGQNQQFSPRLLMESGALNFAYLREGERTRIRLTDINIESGGQLWDSKSFDVSWSQKDLTVEADNLNLHVLSDLTLVSLPLDAAQSSMLAELDIGGEASDISLSIKGLEENRQLQVSGQADMNDIQWSSYQGIPAIFGLSSTLKVEDSHYSLAVKSPHMMIYAPSLFREALFFNDVESVVDIHVRDKNIQVQASQIHMEAYGMQANLRADMLFAEGHNRPRVDVTGFIENIFAAKIHKFLPLKGMTLKTRSWLKSAILDGEIQKASFLLNGDLRDWPFDQNQGRFEVHAGLTGGRIDYLKGWPLAEKIDAQLHFINSSMQVEVNSGETAGVSVSEAKVQIPDLRLGMLDINVKGRGKAQQLVNYVNESPLSDQYKQYYQDWDVSGNADVMVNIQLPLKDKNREFSLNGLLWPQDVSINHEEYGFSLSEMNGQVIFDRVGFFANDMDAVFSEHPVSLQIASGAHTEHDEVSFETKLNGLLPTAIVFESVPEISGLLSRFYGESDWFAEIQVDDTGIPKLKLETDLVGVHIDLPAPAAKAEGRSVDLTVETTLPIEKSLIRIQYGDNISAAFKPDEVTRAVIQFGDQQAELPSLDGLYIRGDVDDFDVWTWISDADELFAGADSGENPWLQDVDLQISRLYVMSKQFEDVTLKAWPENGVWRADLQGERIDGTVTYTPVTENARDTLTAEFDVLYWPDESTTQVDLTAQPSTYPGLHLFANDLYFGDIHLGETRMEAFPIPHGLQVEQLTANNTRLNLSASGRWLAENNEEKSEFEIHLTSESLGDMLDSLGFSGIVKSGQTIANLDVWWKGPPTAFKMDRLQGVVDISVGSGRVLEVQTGAGRILGLFSLKALPRRLLLDFSDLFGKGLAFDKITGQFTFNAGVAHTDGLKIMSRLADIVVVGDTDLSAQTYDQLIFVVPEVGQSLPILGALAGGPVGAAVMLAVGSIVSKNMNKSGGQVYKVSGPWDKPEFDRIENAVIPEPKVVVPVATQAQ